MAQANLAPPGPVRDTIAVMLSETPAEGASWLRWLPGWQTLRHYQRSWLRQDVAAGLVLTSMLLPVGLAYAQASGLPGICGLYATIVPLLAYAIFGPSRILVLARTPRLRR